MLLSLIFTCATIFSEPTQVDTIFSRQDTKAYPILPDEYKGLIQNWMPSSLGVGSQQGLYAEPVNLLDFGVYQSESAMWAYQQDLRKVLVIVDCTVWDDGTVSPRAICEVVYVPEPATLGLAVILLIRRRCSASFI